MRVSNALPYIYFYKHRKKSASQKIGTTSRRPDFPTTCSASAAAVVVVIAASAAVVAAATAADENEDKDYPNTTVVTKSAHNMHLLKNDVFETAFCFVFRFIVHNM